MQVYIIGEKRLKKKITKVPGGWWKIFISSLKGGMKS